VRGVRGVRLATFTHAGRTRIGPVADNAVLDLSEHAPELPTEMRAFLSGGPDALAMAREVLEHGGPGLPVEQVHLEAPVPNPSKFLAIGLNYGDHIEESGMEPPKHQMWFNKQVTCVNPPFDPIHLPRVSTALDYEGELGIVIGRRCRHVPRERAREVIAGYCIVDDVSVRDWQMRAQTMTIGKSFDTHGPVGPWIVTPDEVGDPHALEVRTWVNGELRQHSNTKHLIFDCYDQIVHLSTAFTLEPGDILATGTPAGVGMAFRPPKYLIAGDVVRIEIERIGAIEHTVVDEPEGTVLA
jgi:2-keto-4-pentenoate hydratase/2-oxohepta-3-ene-1,7-dioic acid hydratase in catechol pathway